MNVALYSPFHILSICSGSGAGDLAIRLAVPNARTVCYLEREAHAAASLVRKMEAGILAPAPVWSDVRTFDGRPWRGRVHSIVATYPCQGESAAGKRLGEKDHRWIWPDIARIIEEIDPPLVFIENVRNHLRLGFRRVCEDLCGMGREVRAGLFSSEAVGAPHGRVRLFALAVSRRQCDELGGFAFLRAAGRIEGEGDQRERGGNSDSGSSGTVANTGCAGSGRAKESAIVAGRGASGDDSGTSGTLGDAERARRDGRAGSGVRVDGRPHEAARSGETCGDVEYAKPAGRGTERIGGSGSEPGNDGQGEKASGAGIGSETLAESTRQGLPLRKDHTRDGGAACGEPTTERRSSELADTEHEPRGPEHESATGKRQDRAASDGSVLEPGSTELAESTHGGFRELREPSEARGGFADGDGAQLANSEGSGHEARNAESGRDGPRSGRDLRMRRGSGERGDQLERPYYFPPYRTGDWERWADVLVRSPFLRPALAQAETEQLLRRMASGVADQLEFSRERIDRLRSVGEGVTPLAMAFAFVVLLQAHGIDIGESAESVLTIQRTDTPR